MPAARGSTTTVFAALRVVKHVIQSLGNYSLPPALKHQHRFLHRPLSHFDHSGFKHTRDAFRSFSLDLQYFRNVRCKIWHLMASYRRIKLWEFPIYSFDLIFDPQMLLFYSSIYKLFYWSLSENSENLNSVIIYSPSFKPLRLLFNFIFKWRYFL